MAATGSGSEAGNTNLRNIHRLFPPGDLVGDRLRGLEFRLPFTNVEKMC